MNRRKRIAQSPEQRNRQLRRMALDQYEGAVIDAAMDRIPALLPARKYARLTFARGVLMQCLGISE